MNIIGVELCSLLAAYALCGRVYYCIRDRRGPRKSSLARRTCLVVVASHANAAHMNRARIYMLCFLFGLHIPIATRMTDNARQSSAGATTIIDIHLSSHALSPRLTHK